MLEIEARPSIKMVTVFMFVLMVMPRIAASALTMVTMFVLASLFTLL